MISVRLLPALLAGLLPFADAAPKPLQAIKGCTFIPTEWADGDSFRIKTPDGTEHTIRLYGVDCLELHVANDDRNLARLREQRRYFGITDAGKNNEESMKIALALAKEASDLTAKSLHAPFTLSTRFSDGGGDPNFERIYGFITLTDGRTLGPFWCSRDGPEPRASFPQCRTACPSWKPEECFRISKSRR